MEQANFVHPEVKAVRDDQYQHTLSAFHLAQAIAAEVDTLDQPLPFGEFARTRARSMCELFEDTLSTTPDGGAEELDVLAEQGKKIIMRDFEKSERQDPPTLAYLFAEHMATFNEYFSLTKSHPTEIEPTFGYQGKLASLLACELALMLFEDPEAETQLHALYGLGMVGARDPSSPMRVFGMKLLDLHTETRNQLGMLNIFSEAAPMNEADIVALRSANDELWQESRFLREYGVKSAVAPSEVPGMNQWLVQSGFEAREIFEAPNAQVAKNFGVSANTIDMSRYSMRTALAKFMGTTGQFATSKTRSQSFVAHGHVIGSQLLDSDLYEPESGTSMVRTSFLLYPDGHLYTDRGTPIRYLTTEVLGCPEAYEQLRASILALHYDLVVPVHIQRIASDNQRVFEAANPAVHTPAKLQNLILQRRKLLTTHRDAIITGIKEEARLAEQLRATAGHVVTGHRYRLPDNFQASVESRRLALLEIGKVLAEYGEGYQRYHRRGDPSIDSGPGHKVVRRSGKKNRS